MAEPFVVASTLDENVVLRLSMRFVAGATLILARASISGVNAYSSLGMELVFVFVIGGVAAETLGDCKTEVGSAPRSFWEQALKAIIEITTNALDRASKPDIITFPKIAPAFHREMNGADEAAIANGSRFLGNQALRTFYKHLQALFTLFRVERHDFSQPQGRSDI